MFRSAGSRKLDATDYYYSAMMIPVLGTETQRTRRGCGFFTLNMNRSMQCIILDEETGRGIESSQELVS